MPNKIKTAKNQSRELAALKERQRQAEFDKQRLNASQRGYNSGRWQKLRRMVLNRDPVCSASGCSNGSTDVDHIKPRSLGGKDSLDNLQGLCHSCHSRKTAREDSRFAHEKHCKRVDIWPEPLASPPLAQPSATRKGC